MGCVDNRANSFLALSQRVFGLLAVGDVARHFRKATEASRLVAHGRDDHIGPEPRPIFAHSPALVFQPTLARCHAQLLLGLAPLAVFRRIKAGEMLADDLIWAITLNLFCPPVPTDDMPQGIQHENRVALYALHQQPEAFFARASHVLGPLTLNVRSVQRHGGPVKQDCKHDDV